MSKGKKALLLLIVLLNIPVLVLGLQGGVSSNTFIFVSGICVFTCECILGFVGSLIYIIDNWEK